MKRIYLYISTLLVVAFGAAACTQDDTADLYEGGIPVASQMEQYVHVTADAQTNVATFTFTGKGCMPVWIADGKPVSTSPEYSRAYLFSGDYSIDVKFTNANGTSDGYITLPFSFPNSAIKGFQGFSYESPYNMWTQAGANVHLRHFYYAHGDSWEIYPESDWPTSLNENEGIYTVTWTQKTDKQWQAQTHIATDLSTSSSSNYDFSVILMSSIDHDGVTVKLQDETSDDIYYFERQIELTANEPAVFYQSDMEGIDIDNLRLVIDCGGNKSNMTLTIGHVVLKDHANDDGTEIPEQEPEQEVVIEPSSSDVTDDTVADGFAGFKYDSAYNLWAADDAGIYVTQFFHAPGWAQIEDPEFAFNGTTYGLTWTAATTDQWQAQMHIASHIPTVSSKNYDFSVILSADKDHPGVTVKLVDTSNDNNAYFTASVPLKANTPVAFYKSNMSGLNIKNVKLVLDYGGNAADTYVKAGQIVLKDHADDDGTELPAQPAVPDGENLWTADTSIEYNTDWGGNTYDGTEAASGKIVCTKTGDRSSDMWDSGIQFTAGIATSADKTYDFRCTITSDNAFGGAWTKLTDGGDSNAFFELRDVALKAGKPYYVKQTGLSGQDLDAIRMTIAFGNAPANTTVTISDIEFRVHVEGDNDDEWPDNAEEEDDCDTANLWKESYWSWDSFGLKEANAYVKSGSVYIFTIPEAKGQWQAMVGLCSDIKTEAGKQYDFLCSIYASKTLPATWVKLQKNGDDNTYFFDEPHNITVEAGTAYTVKKYALDGLDAESLQLGFDFNDCEAGTQIIISDITLREHVEE